MSKISATISNTALTGNCRTNLQSRGIDKLMPKIDNENAKGGMYFILALMGYEWIPEYIKEPVFGHDCTAESNNHIRPIHYSVSQMWEPFSTLIPSVEAKSVGQRVPLRVIKEGQEGQDMSVIEWILAERERHRQAIANLDKILERFGEGGGI